MPNFACLRPRPSWVAALLAVLLSASLAVLRGKSPPFSASHPLARPLRGRPQGAEGSSAAGPALAGRTLASSMAHPALPAPVPPSRPRILIQVMSPRYGLTREQVEEMAGHLPEAEVIAAAEEEVAALIRDAQGFIGKPTASVLRDAENLRWVQVLSAGVDEYLFPEMLDARLTLTNAKIIQGPEIADHAMAMLLTLARSLHRTIARRRNEEWRPFQHSPIELRGKTALVIGLGGIGVQIAERASAFGMRVVGVEPEDMPYLGAVDEVFRPDRLREALPRADAVFIAAPLTSETRGLLGAEEIALLKKGAYVINVSRGPLIATDALVKALEEGRIAGAGLDVTDPEPLPKGHPLWRFENVIITPHIAGVSDGIAARRLELVKENIRRFAKGLPLQNTVDRRKGY